MLLQQVLVDTLKGSLAQVAIALMRALVVVAVQPDVQIGLQCFDCLIELGAESAAEEFVQHCAVETFHKAIGLWPAYPGAAMFEVVQRQVQFIRMIVLATELPAIVGQHRLHRQRFRPVEGQHVVVQHSGGSLGLL
ncbi:MAG: hypothetical protein BWY10_02582 [Chloroflexi bacterium ADurb.Bin180]|nr:MAG: hypothetical protein BWY10_02582 [Chloroflexi bacterium ADurb.Bin180]